MPKVSLNTAQNTGYAAFGRAADCYPGVCSQPRVDIASTAASLPGTPNMTIAAGTAFLEVETDGAVKVYAGPAATDEVKAALARVISATRSFSVAPGDVVFVWTA